MYKAVELKELGARRSTAIPFFQLTWEAHPKSFWSSNARVPEEKPKTEMQFLI